MVHPPGMAASWDKAPSSPTQPAFGWMHLGGSSMGLWHLVAGCI